MRAAFAQFKRFWTAEELPRWFGLSIVLIYLTGLGAVGYFGVRQVRAQAADQFQRVSFYALRGLADRLGRHSAGQPVNPAAVAAYQRELREIAASVPTQDLRIVTNDRVIIASLEAREINTVATEATAGAHRTGAFVRLPIASARFAELPVTVESATARTPPVLFLEAVVPPEAPRTATLADMSAVLTVVLVVLGALFVVYRRVRLTLRTTARIADRLQNDAESIEKDLASLHLTDATDLVGVGWNRLIDFGERTRAELDRVQADGELVQLLKRGSGGSLAQVLNALQDGIIHHGRGGCIEYANTAACRLIGAEPSELAGSPLPDLKTAGVAKMVLDVVRRACPAGSPCQPCNELVTADEDGSCYRVWVTPLERIDPAGGCLVVIRDVSQQVRADRTREDFVMQVTHELRTPLTNIRAYAETLSSGMFDDPKVITECYNVINKETRRLSRLIEDVLSVSQMEVGSIELTRDSVDLAALISDGVSDVRGLADEKGIDLQFKLPAKLEPISVDRDKMAIVINNLLGNAIKYTPNGGSVAVTVQSKPDEVVITFKDSGIGVDPSDHARVFEKFQRADDPKVQETSGTGIGLYTAREIVRRHGGDIELISEKEAGATFIVRLKHSETRATALSTTREA